MRSNVAANIGTSGNFLKRELWRSVADRLAFARSGLTYFCAPLPIGVHSLKTLTDLYFGLIGV
jgi:hypothetical protein